MQAITLNQAMKNFANFIDEVSHNHEPLIITHENHKTVVLISLDDFNSWQETEYLTRSSANAKDLLQAVKEINEHSSFTKHTLIDEWWLAFVNRRGLIIFVGNKLTKQILKRINLLIKDIQRDPFSGIGKPEPLKHQFSGFWSRRINDEHRLVYTFIETDLVII